MRHLRMSQEQETKLQTWIENRLRELDRDNKERIDADKESDKAYDNDVKARAQAGTIFAESNMPVPLSSYVIDHFSSRSEEEIYGRSPMASFGPEGPADMDSARGLDRFAQYKLFKQGKVRDDLLDANHSAFRHRAQFLKATYKEDIDTWEEYDAVVLYSLKDNQPVVILEHGYVIQGKDRFIDVIDPITQLPAKVLEIDPTVVWDESLYYFAKLPKAIKYKDVFFSGAKSVEVDSDCIRIPTELRTVDEADIIAEYYDKPTHWLKERFNDRSWLKWSDFEKRIKRVENGTRKTDDERKKISKDSRSFDIDNASFGIVEMWIERDVLGWGSPQRIVVWMERKSKVLVDYEFQKKVTPNGRHPYSVTSVARSKNYWWGPSLVEIVKPFQEYIDKQWNRHSFRNSINSNPVIGQNPDAIQEKKSFLEMKPFDVYTLESGKTMQDWLQAFVFPNADHDTQELIEKAIYWVNFWLGISNIARGDYSDVPQNTTLGGQQASLQEASKLSRRWTRRVVKGLEDHLTKLVGIVLATMNEKEAYTYLEGDREQSGFITEDSVRDFLVNAKLIISKDTSTQKLQEQQMTLQTIQEYMTYPPDMQVRVRPVMKSILFLLGHDDVEQLLPVPMMQVIGPDGMPAMVPFDATKVPAPTGAPDTQSQIPAQGAAPAASDGSVVPFPQAQPQPANANGQ